MTSQLTYQPFSELTPAIRELLLTADPDWHQVQRSLTAGTGWQINQQQGLVGEIVLIPRAQRVLEVANLAVMPLAQRQGIARATLAWVVKRAREQHLRTLRVATGTTSFGQLKLYQQAGFRVVAVEPNYFVRHYSTPIYENGLWLRDRLRLERPVSSGDAPN